MRIHNNVISSSETLRRGKLISSHHLSKNPLETVSRGQFCSDWAMAHGGCSSLAPGLGSGSGLFSVSTVSLIFSACSDNPEML